MSSLLDRGRFGLVHKCVSTDDAPCAMKIIKLGEDFHFSDASYEFEKFLSVSSIAPNLTLKPKGKLIHFQDKSSSDQIFAYIVEGVGEHFKISITGAASIAYEILSRLHYHGIIHGDPRMENIVLIENTLRWIDFRGGSEFD